MRQLLLIGLVLTLTSCNNFDRQETYSDTLTKQSVITDSAFKGLDSANIINEYFPPPVDIYEVKHLPFLYNTCEIWSASRSKELYCPDRSKYFGRYYLVNNTNWVRFGELVVFTTDKPQDWKYENNAETFAEIKLETADVKVWDSIGVGTKEKDLIKFFGKNKYYKMGTDLYCDLGEYTASFTILADTVNKLTVGKYSKAKSWRE